MLISDFAIKRPIVTVATMLAIVLFGLAALARLKSDEYPDIQFPAVGVMIAYPGASPEAVEREVIDPLEDRLSTLAGVDRTRSSAFDGAMQMDLLFQFGTDPQVAAQQVRDAIASIRGDLPREMEEPLIVQFNVADEPVLQLTLGSRTLDAAALTRVADPGLTRALQAVPGVAQVTLFGDVTRELTVELRPDAMSAAGVAVSDVIAALQAGNLAAPVGRIAGPHNERSIRLRARPVGPSAFEALPVVRRGGRTVRLGDVATVRDATAEPRTLAFAGGEPALGLNVVKARGYSTPAVTEAVHRRLAELRPTLPAGTTVNVVQDAGVRVKASVAGVQHALLEGALLTVLVVFLFLNSWRSTVITGLALPVSVLASFVAVWAMGFTINMMSLLGLSLAIGILIDDAIVVRENIVRHVEMGKDHHRAAREGTSEIGLAVAATTLSIVAVFVPIGFMGGLAGQWFKPFALTMASSVLVSLFVSFSLDPMLSAIWKDPHVEESKKSWITRLLDRFNRWFDRTADRYRGVIAWALDHRLATGSIAVGSLVAAVALQATVGGSDFMPPTDRGEIFVSVEAPPGSNVDYTARRAEAAARIIRNHPEVRLTYVTVGRSGGAVDQASIFVKLSPKEERAASQEAVGRRLRNELRGVGGATYSVFASGNGPFKQIQVELRGSNADTLTALAQRVAAVVRQVPGAVDVGLSTKGERPELQLELDRGLAGSLGLTAADVAQALRPAFEGVDAGDWVDPQGETRDVMVRLPAELRRDESAIARLPLAITDAAGAPAVMPMGQLLSMSDGVGPAQIDHLGRERAITVQANVDGRPLGDVASAIDARVASVPFPAGYRIAQGGDSADQADIFGRIIVALGIAVVLMYLILVMQFGSFLDPLAVLLSLPLSLVGVVGALLVTGDTLNLMSLIGVMLLMGVVAKNAILLIDFAKVERARGATLREALVEAGRVRLRPILMTTFALIAGMIPVALGAQDGGDFYAPLGRAVIGGTITSTLLTLLVIPTFYEVMEEWKEKFAGWVARRPRAAVTTEVHAAGD
ncbi:MAG TPA: efflux RND transporter permease subunit [Gemmatimonadaceae bacterium]|nr:efflux RND transporter permease subunit [Gemmatimonadaceae bacterium]